ncbi:superoxide dismutase [Salipaludibacillus daqingensis]|uniref:superoxide dismutase n=1 Tax=Salipaludibacillus daqingensis TaxID=3041001 RepID=UPI002476DBBD|nr:superoxide dismutase [Salipaludibacillus daqingensis]
MDTSKDWHAYVGEVDEWMTKMEDNMQVRSSESTSIDNNELFNELENLKVLRGKLLEDKQDDNLERAFEEQVDRVYRAYENWRNHVASGDRKETIMGNSSSIAPGKHKLPPLPYGYDALEPVIKEEIMRLHHQEHHQSYVDGLNRAELEMKQARESTNFDLIRHWEREAAFHGAGHYLHTMFWSNMSPEGGGEPSGKLRKQMDKDFGSFAAFKRHFSEAANKVQGVGWALLVWAPRPRRLEILQAEFHHLLSQQDMIPLLGLDVWEHAYYLQYKNDRKSYVDEFWKIINWNNVNERYEKARLIKWEPF